MDALEKQLESIKAIQNMNCLIVDSTSSVTNIQRLLVKLGAKPDRIEVTKDLESAKVAFKTMHRDVLFIDYDLLGIDGVEVLNEKGTSPLYESKPKATFLISSQDAAAIAASAAESDVDFAFSKPFTYGDLERGVIDTLQKNLNPSPFQLSMEQARLLIASGQYEEALPFLEKAQRSNPSSPLRCAYEGVALWNLKKNDSAKKVFRQGLGVAPTHYRCLIGLFDLLYADHVIEEAHQVARTIAAHHTIPMKRIPDFISLSVKTRDLEHIIDFYKAAESLLLVDSKIAAHLAAGLTIAGTYLLTRDAKTALDAFNKAEIASQKTDYVMESIVIALILGGFDDEANQFLSRASDRVRNSIDVELALLESWVRRKDDPRALECAMKLLSQGVANSIVYHTAIRLSGESSQNLDRIESLIVEAIRHFPAETDHFNSYRSLLAKV